MLLRKKGILVIVILIGLVISWSGVKAEEIRKSTEESFSISARIAGESIQVIPEDINFGIITDLSTSHTADPVTFKVKGTDIKYKIEMEEEVQISNDNGDQLTVILKTPKSGIIEGGEDTFEVNATLKGIDEKTKVLEGNYQGSATVTVQYAD